MKQLSIIGILFLIACSTETNYDQKTVVHDDVNIAYTMEGSGEVTVLFVHGWCIDRSYWQSQMDALSSRYRVVSIDLPGFGMSGDSRSSWTMEAYGNDVVAVIDQLNLDQVILVGHSMGGDVVIEAALQKPEKVIALIGVDNFKDVGVEYSDEDMAEMNGFMDMLKDDFANIAPAYAQSMLFHPSTDSTVVQRVTADFAGANPSVAVNSLQDLFLHSELLPAQLKELRQPLHLINSDATPTYIEGLDATGVRYHLNYIHATGHYPMIEKPEEFNRILRQVVEDIIANDGIV